MKNFIDQMDFVIAAFILKFTFMAVEIAFAIIEGCEVQKQKRKISLIWHIRYKIFRTFENIKIEIIVIAGRDLSGSFTNERVNTNNVVHYFLKLFFTNFGKWSELRKSERRKPKRTPKIDF